MMYRPARFYKALVAVLTGNLLCFAFLPILPPEIHHRRFKLDLGLVVDAWICLCIYGLIELGIFLFRRIHSA